MTTITLSRDAAQQMVACVRRNLDRDISIVDLSCPGYISHPLPFQPLGIDSANEQQVNNTTNTDKLLEQACAQQNQQQGAQPIPPQSFDPTDISAQRYLDGRTDPVQVIRSLYTAINSHQYARIWILAGAERRGVRPAAVRSVPAGLRRYAVRAADNRQDQRSCGRGTSVCQRACNDQRDHERQLNPNVRRLL